MKAKSSVFYPAVIVASLVGVVGLVLVGLQFTVTIEPMQPDSSVLEMEAPQSQSISGTPAADISAVSTSKSKPTELVKQKTAQVSSPQPPAGVAASQASLRVINQTEQPLRVALLKQSPASTSAKPTYSEEPVHWDFAPGEGSSQGLILSLPEGNLKLKKGDILVAFAQDGSRRYWGPYVVGETSAPIWHRPKAEWQLILQP